MTQMVRREGEPTRIVFFCDYCHKDITNTRLAMYAWRVNKANRAAADGMIYFLHKGICDHVMTDADNNHKKSLYDWHWRELSELPGDIMETLKITWDEGHVKFLEDYDMRSDQIMRQQLMEWEQSAYPERKARVLNTKNNLILANGYSFISPILTNWVGWGIVSPAPPDFH